MIPTDLQPTAEVGGFAPSLSAALRTVAQNVAAFGDRYPGDTTADGVYPVRAAKGSFPEGSNYGWTTSFWPGMVWLAYEHTGDDTYRRAGERHVQNFADRVARGVDLDTHDLGFLYTLACVAPWRLTGDELAKKAALDAAEHLMVRFLEPAGIIQAWGDLRNPEQRGRTIIDSLMNMPLLHWASEMTGEPRFREAAVRHTIQLRDHIIRPDNTTFHTFYWDPQTGEPLRGGTEQGHADHSCWARGQAWGIYGFALGFRHTSDETFLRAAERCADYFLEHLPADQVTYWDLAFADGSGEERDSSAAAIAVCGLDEIASWLPDGPRKQRYRQGAHDILASLGAGYSTAGHPESNALLLHGIYDKPKSVGVDEGTLWGDYFYLEALTRFIEPAWTPYW